MPEKDGSEDKKSTKSVVNKKQKQFMNQEEQLDLSSVAESFGGQIVGEPVELDEGLKSGVITTGAKVIKYLKTKPGRKAFGDFVELGRKFLTRRKNIQHLERSYKKPSSAIIGFKKPFKPLKPLKDFIRTGTEKAKTQFQKIKDTLKKNKKKDASYDLSKDYNVSGNKNKSKIGTTTKVAGGVGVTGLGVGTLIGTQLKKRGGGGFRLGGLPGTAHNVGRRTNPQ